MRVFFHKSKLSLYPREPHGVDLIQLPLVGWRFECLRGENLPIARPDDPVDFTKRTCSNNFVVVVDKPVINGLGFTRFLSRWLTIQAKFIDSWDFFLALLGCFLALLDECSQVLNVSRVCCYVIGKSNIGGKAS